MFRWAAVIVIAGLGALWIQQGRAPDPQAPDVSPADSLANSLAKKIQLLRARYEQESSGVMEVEVSEEEANAYLLHRLADQLPEGVIDPWVRFAEGPIQAGANLDLAVLQGRMSQPSLTQLLSGRVPVEVRAQLRTEDGVGRLDLESVTLGGIPLPKAFIQELVVNYTKGPLRPDGVRLEEPFELPYAIESVETKNGVMILRQSGARESPGTIRPHEN